MARFELPFVKDLGLQRKVMDALPYAVVGGAWEGSLPEPLAFGEYYTALNHVVPAGQQLKILFLRVWTQNTDGAKFSIVQTNPTTGQPGFPVVGSVPTGDRDFPMLEADGAEVLHGGLRTPIHVLEGSIDFRILGYPALPATDYRYGIVWWGCQKIPE